MTEGELGVTKGESQSDSARWSKPSGSIRMNFVVDLFRTRHTDPDLFLPPYPNEAAGAIDAGRIPAVPL